MSGQVLLIACGAIARELVELRRRNRWDQVRIQCLPADLHNRPEKIPGRVRELIERYRKEYERIFVAYADCGTGGQLDRILNEFGVERLSGAHCYEFFAGSDVFAALSEEEPGTFYLTDFLVRHFDRLVRQGLGLDRHPELLPVYFGNYRRLVYLAQADLPELEEKAAGHAEFLGLEFAVRRTGLQPVGNMIREHIVKWQS
jgi:hypothetical protein